MTVSDNLTLGAYHRCRSARDEIAADFDSVCTIFPRLRERLKQRAGTLSGENSRCSPSDGADEQTEDAPPRRTIGRSSTACGEGDLSSNRAFPRKRHHGASRRAECRASLGMQIAATSSKRVDHNGRRCVRVVERQRSPARYLGKGYRHVWD